MVASEDMVDWLLIGEGTCSCDGCFVLSLGDGDGRDGVRAALMPCEKN